MPAPIFTRSPPNFAKRLKRSPLQAVDVREGADRWRRPEHECNLRVPPIAEAARSHPAQRVPTHRTANPPISDHAEPPASQQAPCATTHPRDRTSHCPSGRHRRRTNSRWSCAPNPRCDRAPHRTQGLGSSQPERWPREPAQEQQARRLASQGQGTAAPGNSGRRLGERSGTTPEPSDWIASELLPCHVVDSEFSAASIPRLNSAASFDSVIDPSMWNPTRRPSRSTKNVSGTAKMP